MKSNKKKKLSKPCTNSEVAFLSYADIGHCDLLKKMRCSYRAWRVRIQRPTKFRLAERLTEFLNRLPDSDVDEDTASRNTSVQLR